MPGFLGTSLARIRPRYRCSEVPDLPMTSSIVSRRTFMGNCLLILQGTDDPQPAGPAHLVVCARDGQSGGVANGPSFRSRDAEPDHVTSIVRDPSDARGRASPARIPGPRPIPGGTSRAHHALLLIWVGLRLFGIAAQKVAAPLPHVSAHPTFPICRTFDHHPTA